MVLLPSLSLVEDGLGRGVWDTTDTDLDPLGTRNPPTWKVDPVTDPSDETRVGNGSEVDPTALVETGPRPETLTSSSFSERSRSSPSHDSPDLRRGPINLMFRDLDDRGGGTYPIPPTCTPTVQQLGTSHEEPLGTDTGVDLQTTVTVHPPQPGRRRGRV